MFWSSSPKEAMPVARQEYLGFGVFCWERKVIRTTPVAQSAPRNLLTRWDVSSIPANGIFLTKN